MERFKFRVWNKTYKSYHDFEDLVIDVSGNLLDRDKRKYDQGEYIIEQCTGLPDLKGKLIYENDTFEKGGNKFKIEWFDGGFIIANCSDPKKFEVLNVSNISHYEIVITGNIHEVEK